MTCTEHVLAYLEALDGLVGASYAAAEARQRALDRLRDAFEALRDCPVCWVSYVDLRRTPAGGIGCA